VKCEGIVGEYDEELLKLFSEPRKGVTKEFCHQKTQICKEDAVLRDEL